MSDILEFVPFGAEKAKSSREIWKAADLWAESSFAHKLNTLVDAGVIQRRREAIPSGYKHVYWREAA